MLRHRERANERPCDQEEHSYCTQQTHRVIALVTPRKPRSYKADQCDGKHHGLREVSKSEYQSKRLAGKGRDDAAFNTDKETTRKVEECGKNHVRVRFRDTD